MKGPVHTRTVTQPGWVSGPLQGELSVDSKRFSEVKWNQISRDPCGGWRDKGRKHLWASGLAAHES